jgi:HSP20 family molecular chaperone IbpA
MRSTRWQSFNPVWNQLSHFQEEMNRLFDRWNNGSSGAGPAGFPALNVWEDGEEVFVEAEFEGSGDLRHRRQSADRQRRA